MPSRNIGVQLSLTLFKAEVSHDSQRAGDVVDLFPFDLPLWPVDLMHAAALYPARDITWLYLGRQEPQR